MSEELIAEAERLVQQSAANGNPVAEFGVTKGIAFVRGVRFAIEALSGPPTAGGETDPALDDLDRLVMLAEAATPGPWVIGDPQPFLPGAQVRLYAGNWEKVVSLSCSSDRHVEVTADGRFIAAANPKVVRALVQRVRDAVAEAGTVKHAREAKLGQLREVLERAEQSVAWAHGDDWTPRARKAHNDLRKALADYLGGEQ